VDEAELDGRLADALDRLGLALHAAIRHEVGLHHLTPLQARVLLSLAAPRPAARRVKELGPRARRRYPDHVPGGRRAGSQGSGRPAPDPADRRAKSLACTSTGRAVARRLDSGAAFLVPTLADLAPADRAATLGVVLDLIGDHVERDAIAVARTCTTCRFFQRGEGPDDRRPTVAPYWPSPSGAATCRSTARSTPARPDPPGTLPPLPLRSVSEMRRPGSGARVAMAQVPYGARRPDGRQRALEVLGGRG
jgi:hypothetical protein